MTPKVFFFTLLVHLTTLFSKIFCFSDFFEGRDGTGQDTWTDRHFLENTKDVKKKEKIVHSTKKNNFALRLALRGK